MKHKILYTALLFTGFSLQQSWALGLKDAPIQKVTVYPNGALVERSLLVRAGERLIQLEGLPANFDISALQVQSENIDVDAVTSVDSALNKPSGRESADLQAQIKSVAQRIAELNAKIQAAELQNKFLANITTGNASTVRQQAYDAFLTISTATQQKQELEQRLKELNQDLSQIGDHRFNGRTLQLHVRATQSGTIHLAYQVPYATWRPSYKAELNSTTQQLTFTRMVMIAQKTGEDWDNVQLTLSTNTPKTTIKQVNPETWLVNYYEPEKESLARPVMEAAAAPMMAMSAKAQRFEQTADEEPNFPQFEQVTQTYSTQFTTSTKASIPSSKQQITLPLNQQTIPAKLSAWILPQQQQRAFLNAEIPRLAGDFPQGIIKLYRDGDYIGQREWQNPTDDRLNFNFGEDEKIQVKILNNTRKQDPSGAFNKSTSTTLNKQYQITNLHPQPMQILLFESLPQSQNTALKVTNQFSQPPTATEWQGQKEIYQWSNTLAPQQRFTLDVNYQLKYPNEGYATGF